MPTRLVWIPKLTVFQTFFSAVFVRQADRPFVARLPRLSALASAPPPPLTLGFWSIPFPHKVRLHNVNTLSHLNRNVLECLPSALFVKRSCPRVAAAIELPCNQTRLAALSRGLSRHVAAHA